MKIDISQVKDNVIFWADNVKSKELKTQDIKSLEYDINKNSFDIKTNKEQDYNIFFKFDESNIGVKISEDNINRLKEFFNEDNFINNNKGMILDKDAASFVAGWFSDIAYKSNFLAADRNKDGELNQKEIDYTINAFALYIEPTNDDTGIATKTASYVPSVFAIKNVKATSISKELDQTLTMDKNLDGFVTIAEKYENHNSAYEYGIFFNNLPFMTIPKKKIKTDIEEELIKELKEQIKLNEILEKLKKSQTLDDSEKILLQKLNLKNISENLKISEDKLKDLINNDKLADFINFSQDFVKTLSKTKLIDIKV